MNSTIKLWSNFDLICRGGHPLAAKSGAQAGQKSNFTELLDFENQPFGQFFDPKPVDSTPKFIQMPQYTSEIVELQHYLLS